ncbi:SDR family oxidoreductase [Sorangium sp. So ce1335]|uniref:SDR family oxidoreductase n=1 Tax=Sorangium sp. So ce1335 TaxID=3133335 RepID=UPI003F648610
MTNTTSEMRHAAGFAGLPGDVLLTGASGFLGIHLLHDLLVGGATVSCLLRGESEQGARRSLEDRWRWFFPDIEIEPHRERLRVIVADVTARHFGLNERAYDALAETHGAMFNVAGNVNGHELHELLPINVGLVESLIELSRYGCPKHLHHVSTVGVVGYFRGRPPIEAFAEQHLQEGQVFLDAYSESKYRAEVLLRQAMAQGIAATAYRVGFIGPHGQTGKFQQNPEQNYTSRYVRACVRLGFAPYLPKVQIPITPVDAVARAILALGSSGESAGQTYYVETLNPVRHYEVMRVLQAAGYPLRLMEVADLIGCAARLSSDKESLGLVLPQAADPETLQVPIDAKASLAALARCGFDHASSGEWLGRFVAHAIEVGFLPPPRFWGEAPLPCGLIT